jgi:5-methylcytosine-specific restriction endonuclease McrBC GTP-binding regulatory subunit McrB
MNDIAHNTILYGPPGTGKTYHSVIYAVAICDDRPVEEVRLDPYSTVQRRYNELKEAGRIVFTTFHQSYGYEEFIEGITPELDSDDTGDSALHYVIKDGIFKKLCHTAVTFERNEVSTDTKIWFVRLAPKIKQTCFSNGMIQFALQDKKDDADFIIKSLREMTEGDYIISYSDHSEFINAIGIVQKAEPAYDDDKTYSSRKVEWLIKDVHLNVRLLNDGVNLPNDTICKMKHMSVDDLVKLINENQGKGVQNNTEPYVIIIDEINRGNISKIFGELITLIEDTKRAGAEEEMEAVLPYSGEKFSVPQNVYLLGTMNTADRSIALMDTALRRRFAFIEMMPDSGILDDLGIGTITIDGEELNVSEMLDTMNRRIEYLFDREHTIGHAFFTKLAQDPSIDTLAAIFEKNIIPLLQEYFYEDYEKIQLVLGDNGKDDEFKFILDQPIRVRDVFNGSPDIDLPKKRYTIQREAFCKPESYQLIARGQ